MGRRKNPEYEIRVVSNAHAPAVARREPPDDPDGLVIVWVDENLQGKARDDAVHLALAPFREGRLDVVPVPFFAVLWDAGARKLQEYPRVAGAVAGAGTAAAVGMATLTLPGVLDGGGQRAAPLLAATTATTVIQAVEPTATAVTPTAASTRSRAPSKPARRSPEPTVQAEPAFDEPPKRARPAPTRAARTPAPKQPTPVEEEVMREESAQATDRPTVDEQPDHPTPEPQTEPEPLLTVELELELGGNDCRVVELDVGVGGLLGAGACR